MRALEVVERILAAGGALELNGDRIRYRIPEQAAPLVDELRRHKTDVVSLLRQPELLTQDYLRLLPFLGKGLKTKPAMAPQEIQQESSAFGISAAHGFPGVFPHCPRCGSYYLYRANNGANYECQTCELRDITEDVAQSPHRA